MFGVCLGLCWMGGKAVELYLAFSTMPCSGCSSSLTSKSHDGVVTVARYPKPPYSSFAAMLYRLLASLALAALYLAATGNALPYLSLGKVGDCRDLRLLVLS